MTNKFNQGYQATAGRNFGSWLMLVSLVVCYLSTTGASAANQASLSVNNARIVGCPAFLDVIPGQLVSSESTRSEEKINSVSAFSASRKNAVEVLKNGFIGRLSERVLSSAQPVTSANYVMYAAGSFTNEFILRYTALNSHMELVATQYTRVVNYGSSERFQA
jgi:hypothetical protein